jgi:hypothetical protein
MAAPKAGRQPSTSSVNQRLARLEVAVGRLAERVESLEEDLASLRMFVSHMFSSYEKERRYVDMRFAAVDRWLTQLLNPPSRTQFKKETRAIKRDTSAATRASSEARTAQKAKLYDYIAERVRVLREGNKHLSDAKVCKTLANKDEPWLEGHNRVGVERLSQIMDDLYKAGRIPHAASRTPKKKR